MKTSIFVILISLAFILSQCNKKDSPLTPPQKQESLTQTQFVRLTNDFSFNLFQHINQVRQDSNIFISPFSVSMALGMTLNGANGNTYEQIKQVLGFTNYDQESINQVYKNYFSQLQGIDPQVILELANAIWYEQHFNVLQSFLDVNRNYFYAEVHKANFADPSTVTAINNWVKQKTHDKIQSILNYIPRGTLMYLLNAVYFKGTWTYQFDPKHTVNWTFQTQNGQNMNCSMMFMSKKLPYYQTADFQMVLLPYGEGHFNMAVILPAYHLNLDTLITQLTATQWKSWLAACQVDSGTIGLPRFKMEFNIILNDILKEMGMSDAFSPTNADFSRISTEKGLYISIVKHKTFVEVNEEGTEATGVTLVGMERSASNMFELIADHPFVFIIYEKDSQAILFMGKMEMPVNL